MQPETEREEETTWLHHRRWKQGAGARRSGAKGSPGVGGGNGP